MAILEQCASACARVCMYNVGVGVRAYECACVYVRASCECKRCVCVTRAQWRCVCSACACVSAALCGCVSVYTAGSLLSSRQSWSPGPFPGPG